MKNTIDNSKHIRVTNYARQKIKEGVSEKRIVGELVALENIRKKVATQIVQDAKSYVRTLSSEHGTQFDNLYEWIQDWLDKGISHLEIIDNLKTKGIDHTQAWDMLLESVSFKKSKNARLTKAQYLTGHTNDIHHHIQLWRKQLLSPESIQQKLQYHYQLTPQEAQDVFQTIDLHKKANQEVGIQVSEKKLKNKPKQCLVILLMALTCATVSFISLPKGLSQTLGITFLSFGAVFILYKLAYRSYQRINYIK